MKKGKSSSQTSENERNYSKTGPFQEKQISEDDDQSATASSTTISKKELTDLKIRSFLARQFVANEKRQEIRSQPDSEIQFNPPPEKFKLYSAIVPDRKPIIDSDRKRTTELYQMSLKKKVEPEPIRIQSSISEKSKQLANARNVRQIKLIFTGMSVMDKSQFDKIMNRFSIKSPSLIQDLKDFCYNENDDSFNGKLLRNLFIAVANKEYDKYNNTKLAKKLLPFILSKLANSVQTVIPGANRSNTSISPRRPNSQISNNNVSTSPKDFSKNTSLPNKKNRQIGQTEENTTTKDTHVTIVDNTKTDDEIKPTRQKISIKGSKYLPAFYENIEFHQDNTPRYRYRKIENTKTTPWK